MTENGIKLYHQTFKDDPLAGKEFAPLRFTVWDRDDFSVLAPESGWTYPTLETLANQVSATLTRYDVAEMYLGDACIGSTEM